MTEVEPDALDWSKNGGLLPAICQDALSGEVLMLAYMNREALDATREQGQAVFYSRSKQRLWRKGETSGNVLEIESIAADCDADTLLLRVRPQGPACHLGTRSCFAELEAPPCGFLAQLDALVAARAAARPSGSYTTELLDAGTGRCARKLGEEATETVVAALSESDDALVGEAADLMYHMVVLLQARGLGLGDVCAALAHRHG